MCPGAYAGTEASGCREIALELKAKEPEKYETTTSILCYLLIGRENRVGDLFFAVNRLKCS